MDGKGRAIDNIFVEWLWRSVKYEDLYLKEYSDGTNLYRGLNDCFEFYNFERPHESLEYQTPAEIYFNFVRLFRGLKYQQAKKRTRFKKYCFDVCVIRW